MRFGRHHGDEIWESNERFPLTSNFDAKKSQSEAFLIAIF